MNPSGAYIWCGNMEPNKICSYETHVAQRAYKISILSMKISDQETNTQKKQQTKFSDAVECVAHVKQNYTDNAARRNDDSWTKRIIKLLSREEHRSRGRLNIR